MTGEPDSRTLRLGTRKSKLALWQANWVKSRIEAHHPGVTVELVRITTRGDKILDAPLAKVGGKGLFVKEIEDALVRGKIDLAVHSMKDVPAELLDGLTLGAVPRREDCRDALVSREGLTLGELPAGAAVGTSSLRRSAQLLHRRPDLRIVPLRGNVDTRLRKLDEGEMDAIVLAAAGLKRLDLEDRISQLLPVDLSLPAIGQGALGIEIRRDDADTHTLIGFLNNRPTALAVTAERALLRVLEGGCQVPIAAHAELAGVRLILDALVCSLDGKRIVRDRAEGIDEDAAVIGAGLGERLLAAGARDILDEIVPPLAPAVFVETGPTASEAGATGLEGPGLPLEGKRILITRPRDQAAELAGPLSDLGADPILLPTIEIVPPARWDEVDAAIEGIDAFDWLVFTSANGVRFFLDRAAALGRDLAGMADRTKNHTKICTIGPKTARELEARGVKADLVPDVYRAEAVVEAMSRIGVDGTRVLLPRAAVAREVLPERLTAMGARVEVVAVYRTAAAKGSAGELRRLVAEKGIDVVTFTSSSTVTCLAELLSGASAAESLEGVVVASIGPITAETAANFGIPVHVEAREYTAEGLTRAIAEYFTKET